MSSATERTKSKSFSSFSILARRLVSMCFPPNDIKWFRNYNSISILQFFSNCQIYARCEVTNTILEMPTFLSIKLSHVK